MKYNHTEHFQIEEWFSYKEPIMDNSVDLFSSENVPWFYHLIHVLGIQKEDFEKIRNFVEKENKKYSSTNGQTIHALDLLNYQSLTNQMLKENPNLKNTLSVYLYACKYHLSTYVNLKRDPTTNDSHKTRFVFIYGNTTADMDSVCSSVLYSFLLFIWDSLKKKIQSHCDSIEQTFFIPVINIQKNEMKLKIMILWWFEINEINNPEEIFIFKDDPDLSKVLQDKNSYDICLVDFNDLESTQSYDIKNIKSILDHHMCKESTKNGQITKSIFPIFVCSCMVIIAYMYKHSSEFLKIPFINKNLMWMIYGTILRDSNNFIPDDLNKRWVPTDLKIFNSLKYFYRIPKKMDLFVTYKFKDIRFSMDVNKIGIENVLIMDCKDYHYKVNTSDIYIRIASIDISVDFLFSNEGTQRLANKLFEVCKKEHVDAFIFIGSYLMNFSLRKDLGLFFFKNDNLLNKIINVLMENNEIKLSKKNKKELICGEDSSWIHIFDINNNTYSRKMLEYLLTSIFK